MGTYKTEQQLDQFKKLIDLNGDTVNFEVSYTVRSRPGKDGSPTPFDLLVVDQTTLDTNPNLDYKKITTGEQSGMVSQNSGVYQNYYLILKAPKPCMVDVEITKKEIPQLQPVIPQAPPTPPPQSSSYDWKKIIIAIVAFGVIGYVLYKISLNPKKEIVTSRPSSSAIGHRSPQSQLVDQLKNLDLS